mgnify:CR=1 FL=1
MTRVTKGSQAVIFDCTWVGPGGWAGEWPGVRGAKAALDRWVRKSYAAVETPLYDTINQVTTKRDEWNPHQCGGCRFMLALDLDYGLCANPDSPQDGRVVFEHGGCPKHEYTSGEPSYGPPR